ncbi:MAG: hypothetical protein JXB46_02565 [Candidatus Eisenbacteria bacterium]|nr:hypothetical protein [Candidatus Eisenbacteria bacterium]
MSRARTNRCLRLPTLLVAALVVACWAGQVPAVTTLEGYSSLMGELRSSGGGDPTWDLSNPQLYAELRLKSSPWRDVDSFLKVSAESNRWIDDMKDTKFFFREAHVRFHAKRFETHLFSGQDRFWLNEPLLQIVDSNVVKQDDYGPRAQGIRADFWDVYGVTGAGFYSERSDYASTDWSKLSAAERGYFPGMAAGDTVTSSTDDYRGFRLTKGLAKDKVVLGTTYARKDYSGTAYVAHRSEFDETMAVDSEFALGSLLPFMERLGRVTLASELGVTTSGHQWDNPAGEEVTGFKTELRDLRVGPLSFLGSWETYGEEFYNQGLASGDRQNLNDYTQYYAEGHYRFPTKAINLKYWRRHAEPEHENSTSYARSIGTIDEWGGEAYTEFLNGFTGKTEYKVYEDRNGIWPNLFSELTGENRLVKLRAQFRIKDINTPYEVTAYGFEANVNISDLWKFYARVMNVDEATESRQTAFAQLRYLGWESAEFFVEFGNPDQSNDLVNDGDFVTHGSSAVTEQVFKAFVRIYY